MQRDYLLSDVPFSVGGLAKATFIGAASVAVTFGIGSAASSMFSVPAVGFWQGAYQGAIIGVMTGAGGTVANAIFRGQLEKPVKLTILFQCKLTTSFGANWPPLSSSN